MKARHAISVLAIAGATVFSVRAYAADQPGIPNEPVRPLIPPGKLGPGQSKGLTSASPAIEVTVAEIMRRPDAYINRNVTVASELEEVFTPWSFKLDEDSPLSGGIDNDLLVVAAEPLVTMGYEPSWVHKKVQVTGTLRMLQPEDVRRTYGRGLDDKLFRQHVGKPALVAQSIRKLE